MPPAITRDTYVYEVARTLWENLPQVIRGALLFNLLCLPALGLWLLGLSGPALLVTAVTLGPAWAALLDYDLRLLQGRTTGLQPFFRAFRHYWRRSALLSLLPLIPLLGWWTAAPALQAGSSVAAVVWVGLGASGLGLAVILTLLLYAFPYLVHRNLWIYACLRDALILASRYPMHTVGLWALGILLGFGIAYISLGLLLFAPAVYGLFLAANCLLVLRVEESR